MNGHSGRQTVARMIRPDCFRLHIRAPQAPKHRNHRIQTRIRIRHLEFDLDPFGASVDA